MRKSKKTTATYDAIGSLTPEEAGALLSAGASSTTIDWKNHDYNPSDIYIGDPPDTLGGGSIQGSGKVVIPLGSTPVSIGGLGPATTVDRADIAELERRIIELEAEVEELKVRIRKGGFRGKPKI